MSVCFLTRAMCKKVRQNLIPRASGATAYSEESSAHKSGARKGAYSLHPRPAGVAHAPHAEVVGARPASTAGTRRSLSHDICLSLYFHRANTTGSAIRSNNVSMICNVSACRLATSSSFIPCRKTDKQSQTRMHIYTVEDHFNLADEHHPSALLRDSPQLI